MYAHEPVRTGPGGAQRLDEDHDGAYGPWTCTHAYDVARCQEAVRGLATLDDVDCDDHDPARYPGAADPDGDGIDQDCDGVDGRRDPATAVTPAQGSGRTYATPPPATSGPRSRSCARSRRPIAITGRAARPAAS